MYSSVLVLLLANYICSGCLRETFLDGAMVRICNVQICTIKVVEDCASLNTLKLSNVTRIQLRSRIKNIYRGAFNDLPKLKYLDISSSSVEVLSPKCFINLPSIWEFNGVANKIKHIPYGVFSTMNFKKIDLSMNEIQIIEPMAFSDMEKLEILHLEDNEIAEIDQDWFVGTTRLNDLNLGKNQIRIIRAKSFKNLIKLKNLDLSFNQIKTIEDKAFSGIKRIDALNLGWNQLYVFQQSAFDLDTEIRTLNLGVNNLTYLCDEIFEVKIKKVSLEPNPWSCPCLYNIGLVAYKTNVQILPRKKHLWNYTFPVCVAPRENPMVCSSDFAKDNIENLEWYYEMMEGQINIVRKRILKNPRYSYY